MRKNYYWRHFRLFGLHGELLPRGGVTVLVEEFPNEDGYDVAINAAVCSDKDHYNKSIGRQVTWGRRRSEHESVIPCRTRDDIRKAVADTAFEAFKKVNTKVQFTALSPLYQNPFSGVESFEQF